MTLLKNSPKVGPKFWALIFVENNEAKALNFSQNRNVLPHLITLESGKQCS